MFTAYSSKRATKSYIEIQRILVPFLIGKVIGKKGNTIQGIMEKSRVLNVKIMGDDEARKKNIDTKDKVLYLR